MYYAIYDSQAWWFVLITYTLTISGGEHLAFFFVGGAARILTVHLIPLFVFCFMGGDMFWGGF